MRKLCSSMSIGSLKNRKLYRGARLVTDTLGCSCALRRTKTDRFRIRTGPDGTRTGLGPIRTGRTADRAVSDSLRAPTHHQ